MTGIAWRSHPDEDDWLFRPVERGWCRYESLKDGTLDLADVLRMNDHIDVIEDNRTLAEESRKAHGS